MPHILCVLLDLLLEAILCIIIFFIPFSVIIKLRHGEIIFISKKRSQNLSPCKLFQGYSPAFPMWRNLECYMPIYWMEGSWPCNQPLQAITKLNFYLYLEIKCSHFYRSKFHLQVGCIRLVNGLGKVLSWLNIHKDEIFFHPGNSQFEDVNKLHRLAN